MPEPSLADLFNIPLPDAYEFEGKTYPVRPLTKVEQGYWSKWLAAEAMAFVEQQTHLPAEALAAHRDGVRADAQKGKFKYYSPVSIARMTELDGVAKQLSITLLADGYAECDHDYCLRMLLAQAEKGAVRMMELEAQNDPKAKAGLDLFRTLLGGSVPSPTTTPSA